MPARSSRVRLRLVSPRRASGQRRRRWRRARRAAGRSRASRSIRQICAESRRDRRRQGHRHHHQREAARRRLSLVDIADYRPRQHNSGAGAEAFQYAAGDQHLQARGRAAQHRPEQEHRQAGDQNRASAEAVRQRTVDELPRGNSGEIRGSGRVAPAKGCRRTAGPAAAALAPPYAARRRLAP